MLPPAPAGLALPFPALSFLSASKLWKKFASTSFCVPPLEGVGEVGSGGEVEWAGRGGESTCPFENDEVGRAESWSADVGN